MNGTFISACILTKNVENYITGCLQSLRNVADEIVVVDSGSVDNTIELARYFKPSIFTVFWNNDFGAVRNWAMERCRGDWIIMLDADERLVHTVKFRNHIAQADEKVGAFYTKIISPTVQKDGSHKNGVSVLPRVIRKGSGLYEGVVHEQISSSIINNGYKIRKCNDAYIVHLGYDKDVGTNTDKALRNLMILSEYTRNNPTDFMAWWHLAKDFDYMNQMNDVKVCLHQCIHLDGHPELRLQAQAWLQSLG